MLKLNQIDAMVWVAIAIAVLSLILAILLRTLWHCYVETWGYALVGLWALSPPLWFLYEFASEFPKARPGTSDARERLKQLHELSRNIWLAFVVVLAAIMGIKWGGPG